MSRARNYSSCLERALDGEDVNVVVYKNLLDSVDASLPSMHRYIRDRKKIMKLDEQHMYDIYAPLVSDAEMKLSYEEACDLVVRGLAPLGKDYQALLQKGFSEGWVDVMETTGKRSGAYSTGIFGLHPYVLLNYQPTHDVFTIAHEMGIRCIPISPIESALRESGLPNFRGGSRKHGQRSFA
ncbi:MAG: M3 family metallopeptidase [Candidatus Borkfalkia sp.]